MIDTQRVTRRRANKKRLMLRLQARAESLRDVGPLAAAAFRGTFSLVRSALPFVGFAVLLAALPLTATHLYLYFTSSDHFSVRAVAILGNAHASDEEILTLAGVLSGTNLLTLDTEEVERRVEKHPWVRDAEVEADLPDRLTIRVSERRPMAVASLPQLHMVDDRGVVFKRISSEEVGDLPIITGVTREELADDARVDEAQRWLREAVRVADWYVLHPVAKALPLGEIHVDPLFGFTVATRREGIEVRLGPVSDREELDAKLHKLAAVVADAEARGAELHLVRLDDARDPGRVTVKMHYVASELHAKADIEEKGTPAKEPRAVAPEEPSQSQNSAKSEAKLEKLEMGSKPAAPGFEHILP
jgi:cell division protein FtsQ